MEDLSTRLNEVRNIVSEAAIRARRNPDDVKIVGVSKRHSADLIVDAVSAGLYDIGESRVQETAIKKPIVDQMLTERGINPSIIRWHMIGKLQSNKANKAAELFDVIQSVDSVRLAQKLSVAAERLNKQIEILVEVNISGESAKSGVSPDDLSEFIAGIANLPAISINGLMTIGPLTDDISRITEAFDKFRQLRDHVSKQQPALAADCELSMGMSGDYILAIEAGATIVRIGTAIFGDRPKLTGA